MRRPNLQVFFSYALTYDISFQGVDTFLTWASGHMKSMRKNSVNSIRSVRSTIRRHRNRRRGASDEMNISDDKMTDLEQEGSIEKDKTLGKTDKNFKSKFLTVPEEILDIDVCSEDMIIHETQFSS